MSRPVFRRVAHDRLSNSPSPIIGIGGDFVHESSSDRAGRAGPLFPGSNRAGVDAQEIGEERLTQAEELAHRPDIDRPVLTCGEVKSIRTDGETLFQRFPGIQDILDLFEGFEDLGPREDRRLDAATPPVCFRSVARLPETSSWVFERPRSSKASFLDRFFDVPNYHCDGCLIGFAQVRPFILPEDC